MGLYDNPMGALDPRAAMMMQMGMGLMRGPSTTPISLGQSLGQAGQQGLQAFQQAQQANQQQQMFAMKMAEEQRQAKALQEREAGQAELMKNPQFAQFAPLLRAGVPLSAIMERAMPKQVERKPLVAKPGDKILTPEGDREIYSVPDRDDDFTRTLKAAGIDPASPEGQRVAKDRLAKMTTHPSAPSAVAINKTGSSLANEIGPLVAESRNSALGALQAIETSGRIRTAIDAGNVTLGPTATLRNKGDQFAQVLGIGGKDVEERLINTRNTMRGLSQFALSARKQLKGQGQVSDYEGKLIQRAEAGEIDDFTLPELKDFITVTDKLARAQHQMHKKNVDVMRGREDLRSLVPFYEVPDLDASHAPAAPKVRKFNPKTGKIE